MVILGIETSCDETAASVVENGTKVLSHVLATSANMHAKTGGIIPEVAAREQLKSILPVIEEAIQLSVLSNRLSDRGQSVNQSISQNRKTVKPTNQNLKTDIRKLITEPPIDAIAVTVGPGLIGSLLVGVETAKTLAWVWNKPIVPVNHLVGHIYANFIREMPNIKLQIPSDIRFPALALVVSGGHTDLVLMQEHEPIKWIGGTRDDASGEAFDKTARLLGLPYPGGPAISAEAAKLKIGNSKLKMFPRPMIGEDNFDWSFSGLKTAVAREIKSKPTTLALRRAELAAQIQEAIVDVLVTKTIRAVKKFRPKSLLLGGGVAANARLREKLKLKIENSKLKINLHVPPPLLCTDNASYIAAAAYYNYKPIDWRKITVLPELTIAGEI